jgi:hypothetical protein
MQTDEIAKPRSAGYEERLQAAQREIIEAMRLPYDSTPSDCLVALDRERECQEKSHTEFFNWIDILDILNPVKLMAIAVEGLVSSLIAKRRGRRT